MNKPRIFEQQFFERNSELNHTVFQIMARIEHSQNIIAKFDDAEKNIYGSLDIVKENINGVIANAATSSEPAEKRLQKVIRTLEVIKEMKDVRSEVVVSFDSCKTEVVDVTSGLTNFLAINHDPYLLQSRLGLGSNSKKKRTYGDCEAITIKKKTEGMF